MPSAYQGHYDRLLTDFAKKYRNGAYKGLDLLPTYSVKQLSNAFTVYNRADALSVIATTHGPRSKTRTIDWRQSTDTYACVPQGLNHPITQIEIDNADLPYPTMRLNATKFLEDQIQLSLENEIAVLLTTTTTYAAACRQTLAGTAQWSYTGDDSTVDIIKNIDDAITACAIRPNRMVIGQQVWDVMKRDAALIELVKYTQKGVLTTDVVASVFGLDSITVASAMKSTPAGVLSYVWGKNVVLAHVEPPSPESIMLGATFAVGDRHRVRAWRDESVGGGAEFIEVNWAWQPKIIASDCGAIISAAIA